MPDVKEVVNGLEMSYKYSNVDENNTLVPQWIVLHAIALLKEYERAIKHQSDHLDALLKAQEPRVMTLGDLRDIGSVWELDTPPYLWVEISPSYRWTRGFWVAWREIFDMIDGLHPTYDADNYCKIWRCWTSRPTDEQRKATPWN